MQSLANIKDIYPLSPLQSGMLFHAIYDERSTHYFEQIAYRLTKELCIAHVEKSLKILSERHDILRTAFSYENVSEPLQVVLKDRDIAFCFEDKRRLSSDEIAGWMEAYKAEDRKKSFNLKKDPLLRASFIRVGEEAYEIIWSFHHIILDGWSIAVLNAEFWDIYNAVTAGRKLRLPGPVQYKSYIQWLEKRNKRNDIDYWLNHLNGYSKLATVARNHQSESYQASEYDFRLSKTLTGQLEEMAQKNNSTLNAMMQAIWGTLLAKYNNTRDVVFGAVVSGRPSCLEGVESMVGMFINTIPVRVSYDERTSFAQLASQVTRDGVKARDHQYSLLAEIQSSYGKLKLLDHILVFENYPVSAGDSRDEVSDTISNVHKFTQTNYDLNIIIVPGAEVSLKFNYNSHTYQASFIQKLATHFQTIASQIIQNRYINVDSIELLSEKEKASLLLEFNDTTTHYPQYQTLQERFEEQVSKTPDHTAAVFAGEELTYQELNERANQLAHYLRKRGVREECLVGICMERSLSLITGVLGILKAGGAYVPMDPEYPKDRIDYMIKDSGVSLVISHGYAIPSLEGQGEVSVIALNPDWFSEQQEPNTNPETDTKGHHAAYVIYTSGSTGNPKGVVNTHRGILNRLMWAQDFFQLNQSDRVLQKTTTCFDVSVWELCWPLLTGATLVLARPGGQKDPEYLKEAIEEHAITTIHFVPSMLDVFLPTLSPPDGQSLRRVLCSGEALLPSQVGLFKELLPDVRLYNLYGPTEAAIDVTCWAVPEGEGTVKTVSIGRPVANTQLYIVDDRHRLLPVGVVGELCIGGTQLARGYLNRPALTQQKFIANPWAEAGERLYRTGDLARWLPDGQVEYLGRVDNQVKIRGNRIELGEVENTLKNCERVRQSVVTACEDQGGNKRLIGYVVPDGSFSRDEILQYVASKLPEYMIPTLLIEIDEMPLLPNGKVDKKALPTPTRLALTSQRFAPPRNPVERFLIEVWNDLLHTNEVGIYDNFFEVGGHSLTALLVTSRILKEFRVSVDLKTFFNHPSIAALARIISSSEEVVYEDIEPLTKRPFYDLSHAQKGLWVKSQFQRHSTTFNIPAVYQVDERVEREALEKAFESLLSRHESLRTTFLLVNNEPKQKINDPDDVGFRVSYFDLADEEDRERQAEKIAYEEAMRPFDLEKGPLLRVKVLKLGPTSYHVLFTMHHIIADLLSIQILVREVMELYGALRVNKSKPLPQLRVQYKEYAAWHNRLIDQNRARYKAYWLHQFKKGSIPLLTFPTDYPRPKKLGNRGRFAECRLDKATSKAVKELSTEQGVTTFITLLTASYVLMYKYIGQNELVVGTPVSGREHKDTENQIGMFVNMLPLRKKVSGDDTFKELLQQVKNDTYHAFSYQGYPYDLLVQDLDLIRDPSRNPLFDVVVTSDVLEGNAPLPGEGHETDKVFNVCKYDVRIRFSEFVDVIAINILYNADLFRVERMEIVKERLVSLIQNVVRDPERPIDQYGYEIEAEKSDTSTVVTADFNFQC